MGEELKWSDVQAMLANYESHYDAIDAQVATDNNCPKCGKKMSYAGFTQDRSYIAVAYCEACDYAEEF